MKHDIHEDAAISKIYDLAYWGLRSGQPTLIKLVNEVDRDVFQHCMFVDDFDDYGLRDTIEDDDFSAAMGTIVLIMREAPPNGYDPFGGLVGSAASAASRSKIVN